MRASMEPHLPKTFVLEALEVLVRQAAAKEATEIVKSEVEKQVNRQKFISEVTNPSLMENPVFDI